MNKPFVLVVEDDNAVRNLIATTLETHDYKYHTSQTGKQAIIETASQKPDIMLLDLGLPDLDGVEIIKKVRTWTNMPIIVISARSEDRDNYRYNQDQLSLELHILEPSRRTRLMII